MKKFFQKLLLLAAFASLPYFMIAYVDVFNVFHWDNIRLTTAEPNKNFVKTKYICSNPQKFNAFIFGSSRAENLPPKYLPSELNGEKLNWYNMSYSEGIPNENLDTISSFLKHNVDVKCIILEVDELSASIDPEIHKTELLRMSYSAYEKNKISFYKNYLANRAGFFSIGKEVFGKSFNNDMFYNFGGAGNDTSLNENIIMKNFLYESGFHLQYMDCLKDVEKISDLCKKNNIKLIVITTPMYKHTYLRAAKDDYYDFLRKLSKITSFYNFSGINKFSVHEKYYNEWSHFRPIVGIEMENIIFNNAYNPETDGTFGVFVTASNVENLISELKLADSAFIQ